MTMISTFDGKDQFSVHIAAPSAAPKAAIIVIQEIFGVNEGIQRKCANWADAGYLAVAPDLFWRMKPGIVLDPDAPEQFQEALGLFGQYDPNDGVMDIEATIRAIRAGIGAHAPVARVGCVGFCLGGRLAYMAAARTDIDASVGYYGVMIDQMLGEAEAISNPLMLHIAGEDGFVNKAAQAAIHAGLDKHPRVTLHDYAGLDHGFADELGQRRNADGAKLADSRTVAFFAQHLH